MRRPGIVLRSGSIASIGVLGVRADIFRELRRARKPLVAQQDVLRRCRMRREHGRSVDMPATWLKLAPPVSEVPMILSVLRPIALGVALAAGLSAAPAQAPEQVGIGLTDTSSDVAFFIADKKGYFRNQGIAVTTTPFDSGAKMIAPLGIGQLDVGGGTVAAGLYNAVERGINIKIVSDEASIKDGYEYSTLLVRKDLADSGRYKDLADLKGMTIATAAQGAGSESSLNEALKKGGLKFSDVNVVYMGFPEMLAAFKNKGIDAGVTNEPTVTRTINGGFAVRASRDTIYPGQQTAVALYSDEFIVKRRGGGGEIFGFYFSAG